MYSNVVVTTEQSSINNWVAYRISVIVATFLVSVSHLYLQQSDLMSLQVGDHSYQEKKEGRVSNLNSLAKLTALSDDVMTCNHNYVGVERFDFQHKSKWM